jgi:hypothetical protein
MADSLVIRVEQANLRGIPPDACPQDVEIFRDGSVAFLDYNLTHDQAELEFGYPMSPKLQLYEFIKQDNSYSPVGFIFNMGAVPVEVSVSLALDSFEHLLDSVSILDLGLDEPYRSWMTRLRQAQKGLTGAEWNRLLEVMSCKFIPKKEIVGINSIKFVGATTTPDQFSSFVTSANESLFRLDKSYHNLLWLLKNNYSDVSTLLSIMCFSAWYAAEAHAVFNPNSAGALGYDAGYDSEKLWQLGRLIDLLDET